MPHKPPVGMPCQYFRSSDKPTAAQITAIDSMGMFTLRITPSDGQPFNQRFVYHKDDPLLEERPADWREKNGVWDYIPGMPRIGEEVPVAQPAAEEKADPPVVQPAVQPQPQRQSPTGPLQRTGGKN